jgi:hypothetical protein
MHPFERMQRRVAPDFKRSDARAHRLALVPGEELTHVRSVHYKNETAQHAKIKGIFEGKQGHSSVLFDKALGFLSFSSLSKS